MRILFILLALSLFISSCSGTQKVKRDGLAPEVSDSFDPKGHLTRLDEVASDVVPIPELTFLDPLNIPPEPNKIKKVYSVSALNVPVEDVLFQLCKDAGYELSLEHSIQGKVSLNAINQPLDAILGRIVAQISGIYTINNGLVSIKADKPLWMSYPVNYVNLRKKSTDAIVMKMSVGSVGGATTTSTGSDSTQTKVEMLSENDFWQALETNLTALARTEQVSSISESAGVAPTTNTAIGATDTSSIGNLANVVINRESGMVSVLATQERQKLISAYLSDVLERSNRQVLIEATVVEVELYDEYQAGIDWASISGNVQSSQSVTGTNFSGKPSLNVSFIDSFTNFNLTALQQFGDTKVLSSPRIMAVSNQTALLKVVDNEVYFTVEVNVESGTNGSGNLTTYQTTVHTVPVGFMMSLTPFITDNNDVSINVRPTISRIIAYTLDPNPSLKEQNIESKIPVIQEREMSTVLKLRNNQTAIIGGLIQDVHSNERAGVPGLSKLPGVGDLFAYRDDKVKKNELVIFIRPVVVSNPDVNFGDLKSLKPFLNADSLNTEKPEL